MRRRLATLIIVPLFAAVLLLMGGCAATGPAVPGQVSSETQAVLEAGRSLDAVGQTFGQTYDLSATTPCSSATSGSPS